MLLSHSTKTQHDISCSKVAREVIGSNPLSKEECKCMQYKASLDQYHLGMPGKSGELGNLVPEKFCCLERNFSVPNKEVYTKKRGTLIIFPRNYAFFTDHLYNRQLLLLASFVFLVEDYLN